MNRYRLDHVPSKCCLRPLASAIALLLLRYSLQYATLFHLPEELLWIITFEGFFRPFPSTLWRTCLWDDRKLIMATQRQSEDIQRCSLERNGENDDGSPSEHKHSSPTQEQAENIGMFMAMAPQSDGTRSLIHSHIGTLNFRSHFWPSGWDCTQAFW